MNKFALLLIVFPFVMLESSCISSENDKDDSNAAIYHPTSENDLGQCAKTLLFEMVDQPFQNADKILSKYFITKESYNFLFPERKNWYDDFYKEHLSLFELHFRDLKSIDPQSVKEITSIKNSVGRTLYKVEIKAIINSDQGQKKVRLDVYFDSNEMNGKQISYYPVNDVKVKIY